MQLVFKWTDLDAIKLQAHQNVQTMFKTLPGSGFKKIWFFKKPNQVVFFGFFWTSRKK